MPRIVDLAELMKRAPTSEDGFPFIECDGTVVSAETLWGMVLAMALKDGAWCIQYDIRHPQRLMYVTTGVMYGLMPPPDHMADLLVRAIDRITRPTSILGRLLSGARSLRSRRTTRSFLVKYGDELIPWVASWPRQAADGPIVVFRETYPGPDPSVPWDRTESEPVAVDAAAQPPAAAGGVTE
jgi:hypothetical protein